VRGLAPVVHSDPVVAFRSAPFISLIVALVLRSAEQRPSRRRFLKTWAIASGAWLCTGWVVVLIAISAVGGSHPRITP
jgi:hypothetical protein